MPSSDRIEVFNISTYFSLFLRIFMSKKFLLFAPRVNYQPVNLVPTRKYFYFISCWIWLNNFHRFLISFIDFLLNCFKEAGLSYCWCTKHVIFSSYPAVTSGISMYQNVWINETHILWEFGENMCYQTQMAFLFMILFSGIGQCFRPAQIQSLENQKSGHVRMILDNIWCF